MNEMGTRRAVAAGINDSLNGVVKGIFIGACVLSFFAHPLIGIGLLLAGLALWLVWRTLKAGMKFRDYISGLLERACVRFWGFKLLVGIVGANLLLIIVLAALNNHAH